MQKLSPSRTQDEAPAPPDTLPPDAVSWRATPGLTPYDTALAAMRDAAATIRSGRTGEHVWLVEHPPTFTAGTSARPEDLFNPLGFPTFDAGRGGQWTYHGPGQRVAYVMLDLTRRHGSVPPRDVRAYVDGLERWMIAALARFGVQGLIRPGRVGVWVIDPATGQEAKIGAIGVRITGWVSWHGISLNVAPDLGHFGGIVPCGITEYGVTSLATLGIDADMADMDAALRTTWAAIFD